MPAAANDNDDARDDADRAWIERARRIGTEAIIEDSSILALGPLSPVASFSSSSSAEVEAAKQCGCVARWLFHYCFAPPEQENNHHNFLKNDSTSSRGLTLVFSYERIITRVCLKPYLPLDKNVYGRHALYAGNSNSKGGPIAHFSRPTQDDVWLELAPARPVITSTLTIATPDRAVAWRAVRIYELRVTPSRLLAMTFEDEH